MKDAEEKRKELMQEVIRVYGEHEKTVSVYKNGKYIESGIITDLLEYLPFKDGWTIEMKISAATAITMKHENPGKPIINIWLHDAKLVIDCRFNLPGNRIMESKIFVEYENIHEVIAIVKLLQADVWDFENVLCQTDKNAKISMEMDILFRCFLRIPKACLFTGAFNPPTAAHAEMAEAALKAEDFTFFIYAASNHAFLQKKMRKLKDSKDAGIFSEKQRLRMLLLMTRDKPDVLVFGIEQGYTYDVLKAVKSRYYIENLFFALGSDKLREIERWGHHNSLLREFSFYVVQRDEHREYIYEECRRLFKETEYAVGIHANKHYDISATMVRRAITEGKDYKEMVSPEVYNELQKIQFMEEPGKTES